MNLFRNKNIIVQGFPGCFHEEAARKYFETNELKVIAAHTFNELADKLVKTPNDSLAIIAIENSIAGTILQNYRILREHHLRIIGEVYLRIRHQLMALPDQNIEELTEVHSHPMALNQCLKFLSKHPHIKLVESSDTALSAKNIKENSRKKIAAIASETAASLYDLNIVAPNIETTKINYTRFFIVQDATQNLPEGDFNKASIYFRLQDTPGSLLKACQCIAQEDINITKLQSFPVLGSMKSYYFHVDLEFSDYEKYKKMMHNIQSTTTMVEVLGVYKKAEIYDN